MELNVKIIAFYIAALFIHLSSNAQRYAYEIGKPYKRHPNSNVLFQHELYQRFILS